jgi:TonB family protein
MAKPFSKCLGKIVLMAAAVLWAGCDDSERNDGSAKQDSLKLKRSAKVFVTKAVADPGTMDSVISAGLLYGSPGGSLLEERGVAIVPAKSEIILSENSSLDSEKILKIICKRIDGYLQHRYNTYLVRTYRFYKRVFNGEIILKLTIAANGSVEKIQIVSSTTGYEEFDESIQRAVSRWKFPKVKSGETVATFPIRFYEYAVTFPSLQSK